MPSSATITATDVITFVAGTKARATQVNSMFGLFRGNLVPIDGSLSAAASNAYDLGASDGLWRTAYLKQPPYVDGNQMDLVPVEYLRDGPNPPPLLGQSTTTFWDMDLVGFPHTVDRDARFSFVVPPGYVQTNRIALNVRGYALTTGNMVLNADVALFRPGANYLNTETALNLVTTTATIAAPSTVGSYFSDSTLKLTAAGGTVNGITVAVGDLLTVVFRRKGSSVSDTLSTTAYFTNLLIDLNN